MPFEVEFTNEFGQWFDGLTEEQRTAVEARVDLLVELGPTLKRPVVGEIQSSAFAPRMKELRCAKDGALRILFTFDPRRTVILLLGGDKAGHWQEWYRRAVPAADELYRTYLGELEEEGLL